MKKETEIEEIRRVCDALEKENKKDRIEKKNIQGQKEKKKRKTKDRKRKKTGKTEYSANVQIWLIRSASFQPTNAIAILSAD